MNPGVKRPVAGPPARHPRWGALVTYGESRVNAAKSTTVCASDIMSASMQSEIPSALKLSHSSKPARLSANIQKELNFSLDIRI